MNKILGSLICIFLISSCHQSNMKIPNILNDSLSNPLIHSSNALHDSFVEYTKNAVLQAVFSIEGNTLTNFIQDKKLNTIIEINSAIEINNKILDSVLNKYSDYLISFAPKVREARIKQINDWCSFYFVFKTLNNLNYKKVIFFEQVIFEMPQTRNLFDKYINVKIGQDWGSLDVNDNVLVFYDLYKYLCSLSSESQIQIIAEYSKKIIIANENH